MDTAARKFIRFADLESTTSQNNMKCILFLALVAVARAGYLAAPAPVAVAAPAVLANTGSSVQTRTEDGLGNYAFGYDEGHATGGTFRRESGNALGIVKGSYGLRDADGRARVVNYVADALGFRANIQTNEPGVDPSRDPAATLINKAPVAAIAAPAYAAPAIAAPAYAAPAIAAPAYAAPAYAAAPAIGYGAGIAHHGLAYGGHLGLGYAGGLYGHQKVLY